MTLLRELLLPVVAAAMICSLAIVLVPEGRCRAVVKLTAALVMAAAILRPLAAVSGLEEILAPEDYRRQAEAARVQGESAAENLRRTLIAQELESYIVQQASLSGVTLTAQIHLDEDGMPDQVTLVGKCSQEEQDMLETKIVQELGIPADRQIYLNGEGEKP